MGVSTIGSTCVQASVDDQAAFVVVGGSAQQEYNGLQHYSFQNNAWKSDEPADGVATNRQRHGAAYLQQSSQILTYGGSQENNSTASSQTFLLSTQSPYDTQAFSSTAPPVSDPLILPYNTTHALMLGGDPANTKLYTFGPQDGWQQHGVSLQNGLKDSSKVQATILNRSDGSKVLEIFDMSATPNQIDTVLLQNATTTSNQKRSSPYRSALHHPAKRRKRDTSMSERPAYNNTLAPQDSRSGFSLASDSKTGLVIATGGNSQAPLAIFNETGNQWIDPNQFFGSDPDPIPSTSLPPSSSTPTATAAPSAAAETGDSARDKSLTILGGTLGGVLAVAILLIILLFLLRRSRRRKQQKEGTKENNYALEGKEEMDFKDVGADFMKEAGGSMAASTHRKDKSNTSVKYNDRSGATTSQSKRALLHAKGDSADSGNSFWSRGTKSPENTRSPPQISAPIMGPATDRSLMTSPEPRTAGTGWSRYFANNNTQEMLTKSSPPAESQRDTYLSNTQSQSDYASSRITSSHPHESAEVEPLNFRPSLLNIPPTARAVSPTNFQPQSGLGVALTHGVAREPSIESPTPSVVSDILEEEDEYRHSAGQDSWTPVGSSGDRDRDSHWTDERPVSSYTNSLVYPHPGERVRIPNFPMPSARNSTITSPTTPQPQPEPPKAGLRNVVSRDLIRSNSQRQRATNVVRTGTQRVTPSTAPTTTVRTFPRPNEQAGQMGMGRGSDTTGDMSWLNLGTSAEQQSNHLYFPGR